MNGVVGREAAGKLRAPLVVELAAVRPGRLELLPAALADVVVVAALGAGPVRDDEAAGPHIAVGAVLLGDSRHPRLPAGCGRLACGEESEKGQRERNRDAAGVREHAGTPDWRRSQANRTRSSSRIPLADLSGGLRSNRIASGYHKTVNAKIARERRGCVPPMRDCRWCRGILDVRTCARAATLAAEAAYVGVGPRLSARRGAAPRAGPWRGLS